MQPEEMVGQTLGHYRILRPIGYGGMATVFLAQDINLQREVAIKVFWPRAGETRDFLRRFSREARVVAQLDHPNILPVYDYGEQDGLAYLVMPYMPGGSLKDLLQQRKVLPPEEAISLASQILSALQYASERGIIHRDIKPGNILLKADGTLMLSDFGIVKVLSGSADSNPGLDDDTHSQTGAMIAGTPEYMSPEQIKGKATLSSDIYSVGVVLYEMLTGTRPFTAPSVMSVLMKHVNESPRPPREINPQISPQLESVVLRALEKDPAKRYQRPADFQRALAWASSFQRTSNPASEPGLTLPVSSPTNAQPPVGATTSSSGPDYDYEQNRETVLQAPGYVTPSYPLTPAPPTAQAAPVTSPPRDPYSGGLPGRISPRLPLVLIALIALVLIGTVVSVALSPLGQGLFGPHTAQTPTPTGIVSNKPGATPSVKSGITPTATPAKNGSGTPGTGGTTGVPATTTTCPAAGTVRAAVTAPLSRGSHPVIIYIVNEGSQSAPPTTGTLKRYDTVTGAKTEIVKMPNTIITEAQVSADGSWILFTVTVSGQYQLRMVRVDGQGLQTLLCAPSGNHISGSQWSLDQQLVVFDSGPEVGAPSVYLLNMTNGSLQTELVPQSSGPGFIPRTWLDKTRILMIGFQPNSDAPPQNVYLLDTSKGANQQNSDLQQVVTISQRCWDFDSNGDSTKLYVSQCNSGQPNGSSTISVQPATGGTQSTIFSSSTLAITGVRTVDLASTTLLFTASNTGQGVSGDTSQDGLWKVKTDGTGLTRLTTNGTGEVGTLNQFSQYFWSNLSRDGSRYALQVTNYSSNTYTLLFGSLNAGSPTTFASISGTQLEIAGWTTL